MSVIANHRPPALAKPISSGVSLSIQLFGDMAVLSDGEPIQPPRARKGLWLLALLALRANQEVSRDWLAGTLWPDSMEGLATLRRALTDLRHVLGDAASLLTAPTSQTLRLCLPPAQVDVLAFDAAVRSADLASLTAALQLYHGSLLAECDLAWIVQERAVRCETYLRALERTAGLYNDKRDFRQAAHCLQLAVAADPYRESLRRALMQTLADGGEAAEALHVYQNLRRWMRQELNADPDAETTAVYHRISAAAVQPVLPAPPPAAVSAPESAEPPLFRVPRPLTDIIGRETELQAIAAGLEQGRLLTLLGVGGIGKTRLAIQAAWNRRSCFAEGVVFVGLAALSNPALIPQAIASVLGLRDESEQPLLPILTEALRSRELLLILDNCEHLLEGCAQVAGALLQACPRLHVLATSRQALGLTGEIRLPVPPLALPEKPAAVITPEEVKAYLEQFPAIRLFAERARSVSPAFAVLPRNFHATLQLCAHLDGIPLVLELAAARTSALSVEQILARITDRFRLFTQGNRAALPHQQTLRKTLDWSYDLLSPQERTLFQRLSVFRGGWTLEAAEAVTAKAEGGRRKAEVDSIHPSAFRLPPSEVFPPCEVLSPCEILDVLAQLVAKSLVIAVAEPNGILRYHFLETVREYAIEMCQARGETAWIQRQHREYFTVLLQQEYQHYGTDQRRWLTTLDREYDNLREAIRVCQEADGGEAGLHIGAYLQDYWWIRGYVREGRACLREILAHPGAQSPTSDRAFALNGAGILASLHGAFEEAIAYLEASLAIRRAAGEQRLMAIVLGNLGAAYRDKGDYARAQAYQEEALTVLRGIGLPLDIATALTNLGSVALHQGDFNHGAACYEEALAIRRQLNEPRGVAISLCGLGQAHAKRGARTQALACFDEALTRFREVDDRPNLAIALLSRGALLREQGNLRPAVHTLREALFICADTEDVVSVLVLHELALAYRSLGEPARAVLLFSASHTYAPRETSPFTPAEQQERRQAWAELKELLGAAACQAAWDEGSALSLDKIVALIAP